MFKNLIPRVLTAFALLAIVVPIIWFGGVLRSLVFLGVYGVCIFEIFSCTLSLPRRPLLILTLGSLFVPLCVIWLGLEVFFEIFVIYLMINSLFLILLTEMLSNRPDITRLVSIPLMALVYPGILLLAAIVIDQRYSGEQILWVMASVIMADTLAYFVGSYAGGKHLAPRISPNKTVAGSFAGVLGAALMSLAWGTAFAFDQPVFRLVALGLCIGILAVVGDLFESLLKRSIGVKDMGNSLPGHGGLLDRIDALLFALPVVFFL
ncbi:MAG TPA: phosphatidate cytidylyltransferase [Oligoflexia bacterium]|nr:phosphatidate cytidylyltransferase [Oligoflexia bacterium]HMP47269.1 phosphatidate cytidylyltransferase [Oligoflexia bacterium]